MYVTELFGGEVFKLVDGNMGLIGDINCDGSINLLDVAPFVLAISSGNFVFEADINQDGVVNLLDVDGFIDLLTG